MFDSKAILHLAETNKDDAKKALSAYFMQFGFLAAPFRDDKVVEALNELASPQEKERFFSLVAEVFPFVIKVSGELQWTLLGRSCLQKHAKLLTHSLIRLLERYEENERRKLLDGGLVDASCMDPAFPELKKRALPQGDTSIAEMPWLPVKRPRLLLHRTVRFSPSLSISYATLASEDDNLTPIIQAIKEGEEVTYCATLLESYLEDIVGDQHTAAILKEIIKRAYHGDHKLHVAKVLLQLDSASLFLSESVGWSKVAVALLQPPVYKPVLRCVATMLTLLHLKRSSAGGTSASVAPQQLDESVVIALRIAREEEKKEQEQQKKQVTNAGSRRPIIRPLDDGSTTFLQVRADGDGEWIIDAIDDLYAGTTNNALSHANSSSSSSSSSSSYYEPPLPAWLPSASERMAFEPNNSKFAFQTLFWGKGARKQLPDLPEAVFIEVNLKEMERDALGVHQTWLASEYLRKYHPQSLSNSKTRVWVFNHLETYTSYNEELRKIIIHCHQYGDYLCVETDVSPIEFMRFFKTVDTRDSERLFRRFRELLGCIERNALLYAEQTKRMRSERVHGAAGDVELRAELLRSIQDYNKGISFIFATELSRFYPALEVKNQAVTQESLGNMTEGNLKLLHSDLFFFHKMTDLIPVENYCSQLSNYTLKSEQQKSWYEDAQRVLKALANEHQDRAIGMFLHGKAGEGKTHLVISVIKILVQQGMQSIYLNPESVKSHGGIKATRNRITGNIIWVLDDCNEYLGHMGEEFLHLLENIKPKDVILITSNTDYEEFIHGIVSYIITMPKLIARTAPSESTSMTSFRTGITINSESDREAAANKMLDKTNEIFNKQATMPMYVRQSQRNHPSSDGGSRGGANFGF